MQLRLRETEQRVMLEIASEQNLIAAIAELLHAAAQTTQIVRKRETSTMSDKISTAQLTRKAIVYVRQSTPCQVRHNTESTRLQYGLAQRARDLGFTRVEIIDDDLGHTGSGVADRTGFNDLVGAVCTSEVGAAREAQAPGPKPAREVLAWSASSATWGSAALLQRSGRGGPRARPTESD